MAYHNSDYLCRMKKELIGSAHRLGILGGGQLGRMIIQEALNYNIHVHILESDPNAPCAGIATSYTQGDITDYETVLAFGKDKDVVSVEMENVNIDALFELERRGVKVFPQPQVLAIVKDKGTQKKFYEENSIPTAPFTLLESNFNKSELQQRLPFVHKLRTGGYDGKGVNIVRTIDDLNATFTDTSIVEEMIAFEKELSVIVARNAHGEIVSYPVVECEFNEANLVEFLFSPAEVDVQTTQSAQNLARELITKLNMVGLLAVELFLTKDGELLVNEIAPRPHNSGHHTIECNVTSQFEQFLRAILGLPLGSTEIIRAGAMLNLTGSENNSGSAKYENLDEVLRVPGTHIHLYGKEITKPNRKMGHLTITDNDLSSVFDKVNKVRGLINVIA